MTDSELFTIWGWSLLLAAVIVLIAAALLIAIILTARNIVAHAREAEQAVARIAEHTQVIWALDQTNSIAGDIQSAATDLDGQTDRIATAFEGHSPVDRG
jgi:uncharacterized protein YoxC